jgi:hypothetical protein
MSLSSAWVSVMDLLGGIFFLVLEEGRALRHCFFRLATNNLVSKEKLMD